MHDVRVWVLRKAKAADVAFEKRDLWLPGDVRRSGAEAFCAAGQHRGFEPEVQLPVSVQQGFKQPMAEEASEAGEEESSSAAPLEAGARQGKDLGEVLCGKGLGGHCVLVCRAFVASRVYDAASRRGGNSFQALRGTLV